MNTFTKDNMINTINNTANNTTTFPTVLSVLKSFQNYPIQDVFIKPIEEFALIQLIENGKLIENNELIKNNKAQNEEQTNLNFFNLPIHYFEFKCKFKDENECGKCENNRKNNKENNVDYSVLYLFCF